MSHTGGTRAHHLLIGVVVGTLLTGLVLPFAIGERAPVSSAEAGAGGSLAGEPGADAAPLPRAAAAATSSSEPSGSAAPVLAPGSSAPAGAPASTSAGPVAGAAGSAQPLTATDVGVSATTIRVGIPLIDLGNLNRVGDFGPTDPEGQRRVWQVFVDEINATGGIHGRILEPHYRPYDSLSADDQRAACIHFAQDVKAFAVIGGFNLESPHYCLTEEHGMPTITLGTVGVSDDAFARARGRLVSLLQRGSRLMANYAEQLHRVGALRGKRIGVTGDDLSDPRGKTVDQLVKSLGDLGYAVVHRSRYSSDYATAASQVPVEVQQMQSKRVDAILLLSHSLVNQQFVQQAASQRYQPSYSTTDWAGQTLDATTSAMPAAFEGALGVTSLRFNDRLGNRPDPPEASECLQRYEARSGTKVARLDEEGRDSTDFAEVMTSCVMAGIFRDAATAAGPTLTRENWSRALQQLGPRPILSARVGPGGFGPGKFDAPDAMRLMQWRFACTCWEPVSDFARTPR